MDKNDKEKKTRKVFNVRFYAIFLHKHMTHLIIRARRSYDGIHQLLISHFGHLHVRHFLGIVVVAAVARPAGIVTIADGTVGACGCRLVLHDHFLSFLLLIIVIVVVLPHGRCRPKVNGAVRFRRFQIETLLEKGLVAFFFGHYVAHIAPVLIAVAS